jgi:hypothetical protein
MAKVILKILFTYLISVGCTYAFDLPSFFSSDKRNWIQLGNEVEIDKSSVTKNAKELGSATIKFYSRPRAKEVGSSLYDYTLFVYEFDCLQNEYKITFVVDVLKGGTLAPFAVRDLNIWQSINNTISRNVNAFNFVCKK